MKDLAEMKMRLVDSLLGTSREGIEDLIVYMNNNGFFTAPCSSMYHLCNEGGLLEHSLNVMDTMINFYNGQDLLNSSVDSLIIVSLLHDIGKASYHNKPNYVPNVLKSGKISDSKPYETNKERLYIAHEIVSLQIISRFIELTEEEEFAILYHNGMYTASGRDIQGKERPLQQLLHFSDMWCSRFIETEKGE